MRHDITRKPNFGPVKATFSGLSKSAGHTFSNIKSTVGNDMRTARDWATKRTKELGANLSGSWSNQSRRRQR